MSFIGICLMFFSPGLFVVGKKITEMKCYFYLRSMHAINMIYGDHNYLAEVVFARILYCKVTPFPFFLTALWKEVTM